MQQTLPGDASGRCFAIQLAHAGAQQAERHFWLPHCSLTDGRADLDKLARLLAQTPSLAELSQVPEARLEAAANWFLMHSQDDAAEASGLPKPHATSLSPASDRPHGTGAMSTSQAQRRQAMPANLTSPEAHPVLRQNSPASAAGARGTSPGSKTSDAPQRLTQRLHQRQGRVAARSQAARAVQQQLVLVPGPSGAAGLSGLVQTGLRMEAVLRRAECSGCFGKPGTLPSARCTKQQDQVKHSSAADGQLLTYCCVA